MRKLPKAEMQKQIGERTEWIIRWPCTQKCWGKSYIAITFSSSENIELETASKRQKVADKTAKAIEETVRRAIQTAQNI